VGDTAMTEYEKQHLMTDLMRTLKKYKVTPSTIEGANGTAILMQIAAMLFISSCEGKYERAREVFTEVASMAFSKMLEAKP
jgi:hypothetical protein